MKLSIIIVTWNSAADIETCLNSLSSSNPFELIVIDNASTDGTRDLLLKHQHPRLILNDRNLGYARANNQGISIASGEYVLLLNPDTRPQPDAIDIMAGYLDNHPEIGAVAPQLLNSDGSIQRSIRSFPTPSSVLWELTGLPRLLPNCRAIGKWRQRWFDYSQSAVVDQPMASCLMVRRRLLVQLSGLDERFPIFYNDVDLSLRLQRAGWKTYYLPSARVWHRHGASTAQVRPRMIREAHHSLFRYLQKHDASGFFWLKAMLLLPALEISALVRITLWRLRQPAARRNRR